VAFYYRVEGGEKSMTNAWKIKEAIKQDIDSMTIEQLFAFCNLFEDARQYGISLDDDTFYTCARCRREHNGCLREENEDAKDVCFELFKKYAESEI
jgi:hypothetical protein